MILGLGLQLFSEQLSSDCALIFLLSLFLIFLESVLSVGKVSVECVNSLFGGFSFPPATMHSDLPEVLVPLLLFLQLFFLIMAHLQVSFDSPFLHSLPQKKIFSFGIFWFIFVEAYSGILVITFKVFFET